MRQRHEKVAASGGATQNLERKQNKELAFWLDSESSTGFGSAGDLAGGKGHA